MKVHSIIIRNTIILPIHCQVQLVSKLCGLLLCKVQEEEPAVGATSATLRELCVAPYKGKGSVLLEKTFLASYPPRPAWMIV